MVILFLKQKMAVTNILDSLFNIRRQNLFLDPPWNLAVCLLQPEVTGYKYNLTFCSSQMLQSQDKVNNLCFLNRVDVFTNKLQLVTTHWTTHSYILHSHGAVAAYIQKLLDLSKQHNAMNKTLLITGKNYFIYITNNKI